MCWGSRTACGWWLGPQAWRMFLDRGEGEEVILHLAITRDILVVTNGEWGTATDICWIEDRDAGKHPTSTGHSPQQGVVA